ncbi:TniB family NTP-binding protein [Novosphingobium pentaromativorans]|uniref:Putative TniB-like transposition protein n=2 Tax=Novosphingobium pentaromativorans TaxID=205844 RepID=G6EL22_9SPHN|nr:TniB family NTP-binding protein [Novosphingobium pentaromativorans]EHJ57989.1 putative TniB-like transposition protein [Novosphingobium pentaromativorans US6-1]
MSGHSAFWIDFDEARRAVETLVELAHDEPDERPPCVLLVGQSGMGKTSILRETQRRIALAFPEPEEWGEARYEPMLRTVIPSGSTALKINLTLLWKQGWPITGKTHRIADLKVVELLRRQRTRLVGIDNVHAILTAGGRARRDTLDAFRFLMSEGNVPMVVAGLDVAADIFAEDVELAYRSIIVRLNPWPPGEPSQRLIRVLGQGMQLIEPERLAWAVQCEKERISSTFLACEASALLPRGLRQYACARCWYEARRAGKPEFIRREWILRASWRCREHGLPLSDMGKVPGEPGGRLSLAQLASLVVLAERSLAVARPSQKTIRRNSAALAELARQSEWQRHRAIDHAYRDRFAANVFHFSADRIAVLALALGRRDAAPRRFETLISQALPERPTPDGGSLADQKPPYRLQAAFRTKLRSHWIAPDLLSLLCAYGALRARQGREAVLQAA